MNKDALLEYERLKQNDSLTTIKRKAISDDTLIVLVHNARSLSKHNDDIVSDEWIMNNDITQFTETQINLSDSICKIIKTVDFFSISFGNNENNLSLACWS